MPHLILIITLRLVPNSELPILEDIKDKDRTNDHNTSDNASGNGTSVGTALLALVV